MFRTIAAITCISALSVGLWTTPVFANKANDTLRVAWDQQIDNADAYFNTNREGIILARMVWDQLIDRDPETFQYKPALATAWRWVDDLTLEFDLRQGVKFQDGQPFDAEDVVYTLNFVSNPTNKVLNTTNVGWIKNAEKIDQYKVRIHLKAPFPAALHDWATRVGIAVGMAAWINLLGFSAMTFNFFVVNIVISGLHSYAGLS